MVKKSAVLISFVLTCLTAAAAVAATADQARAGHPRPVVEAAQAAAEESSAAPSGVVNINTASLQQLQLLPGVGPSRAQAIVARREQRPFRRPEELIGVRGIGRATLNRLLPYVVVEGDTTLTRAVPSPRRGRTRR